MNTETKHTPGPWDCGRNGLNVYAKHTYENGHKSSILVHGCSVHIPDEENRANARLIASAPDMAKEIAQLKADRAELVTGLQASLSLITDDGRQGGEGWTVKQVRALIDKHSTL